MFEEINEYVRSLIRQSSPTKTAWNIENIRHNRPVTWNYIDGCMMTALLSLSEITGDQSFAEFTEHFIDAFVNEDGSIRTYEPEKHTLDDINEGRVLFPLYRKTGKEKYRLAADLLYRALQEYMAMPFLALYEKEFGKPVSSDLAAQLRIIRQRMRDPKTGLYYHGYDASRKAFWADPETGCSASFWLRAIGWFSVALADLAEILPEGEAARLVREILSDLMQSLLPFSDPETGMYYQVVDQGGRPGNYLETSGSSMIGYAMLKGARLGVLPAEFAKQGQKTFEGIYRTCLTFTDGQMNMENICLVAGLGPEDNRRRDGTYAYYISEPVVCNDAKGAAPFLLCYTEVKRLPAAL